MTTIASTPEPAPRATGGASMHDLVAADLAERKAFGIAKYGVTLQAHNGRRPLVDAYQEVLDQAVYLKQALVEGETSAARIAELEALIIEEQVARHEAGTKVAQLEAERDDAFKATLAAEAKLDAVASALAGRAVPAAPADDRLDDALEALDRIRDELPEEWHDGALPADIARAVVGYLQDGAPRHQTHDIVVTAPPPVAPPGVVDEPAPVPPTAEVRQAAGLMEDGPDRLTLACLHARSTAAEGRPETATCDDCGAAVGPPGSPAAAPVAAVLDADDEGTADCPDCAGGETILPERCSTCGGRGFIDTAPSAPPARVRATADEDIRTCPTCKGDGVAEEGGDEGCPGCGGFGYLEGPAPGQVPADPLPVAPPAETASELNVACPICEEGVGSPCWDLVAKIRRPYSHAERRVASGVALRASAPKPWRVEAQEQRAAALDNDRGLREFTERQAVEDDEKAVARLREQVRAEAAGEVMLVERRIPIRGAPGKKRVEWLRSEGDPEPARWSWTSQVDKAKRLPTTDAHEIAGRRRGWAAVTADTARALVSGALANKGPTAVPPGGGDEADSRDGYLGGDAQEQREAPAPAPREGFVIGRMPPDGQSGGVQAFLLGGVVDGRAGGWATVFGVGCPVFDSLTEALDVADTIKRLPDGSPHTQKTAGRIAVVPTNEITSRGTVAP